VVFLYDIIYPVIKMTMFDKMKNSLILQNEQLEKVYGNNIHDYEFGETVEEGIVNPLLDAREKDEKYCVVLGTKVPEERFWDPTGNNDWNPVREYITTEDIASNSREDEKNNIYNFLRGQVKENNRVK